MKRPAAPERHGSKYFRIMTALNRNQPYRARHFGIGHFNKRFCGFFDIHPQWVSDMRFYRGHGGVTIQSLELVADRFARINAAQNQICICNGGAFISQAIARRTGIRARAIGSYFKQACFIDMRD